MKTLFACLYGGASEHISDNYKKEIERLGEILVENGFGLVYGAGATGCMGAVARGVHKADGYICGTTPKFMSDFESIYPCDNLVVVDTMNERKMIMEKHADIFIVAPGGVGTMDEFFQVVTLKHLKQMNTPIILLNIDGYYDTLLDFMKNMVNQGFASDRVFDLYDVIESVDDQRVIKYLKGIKENKNK